MVGDPYSTSFVACGWRRGRPPGGNCDVEYPVRFRNASAFCAAAAIVSVLSLAGASAASPAFQVYRPAVKSYRRTSIPPSPTRLWQPSCSTIISSMPAVVGIANITIYDPNYPGGLFATGPRHRHLSISNSWRRGRLRQSDVAHKYSQ